jgi:hypothetical protein
MGVSYRLLAMFLLAPELAGRRTRAVFWLGTCAIAATILCGLLLLLRGDAVWPALAIGGAFSIVALTLYGADIVHLYRARKRRIIELNSRMAAFALAALAGSVALAIGLVALGRLSEQVGALIFLVAFGWLTGLGLAKLYKIVAFLTWLECYGPVLGKAATPRVQDLVVEGRARKWFMLYHVAVWCGTVALLASYTLAFRLAAGVMMVATLAIVSQLVRTRALSDVTAEARFPGSAHRPRFFISTPNPSR